MGAIKNEVLRTFVLWYFENLNKFKKDFSKIVSIIDCIEAWDPLILSCLIFTLHSLAEQPIPFVLVFGCSSTDVLLSQMLENDALSCLSVHRFYFKPSYALYKELSEQILIEASPILFDCDILNKLLSHCELNDFSISRFKDQIRYLFMSYFANTNRSQFAAYFMALRDKECDAQTLSDIFDFYFDEKPKQKPKIRNELRETFQIYEQYRNALKVFKLILDHLDLKWTQTQIIARLQSKDELYKQLMARVGGEDSKYKIASDDRKKYPERIDNFEDCHQIYKILERDTATFDVEFAELASNEFIKITQQLNAVPIAVSKPEKQPKRRQKLTRNELKKQLTQQT